MKLSVDFRGWMWTGLLLLAASCSIEAADNSSSTPAPTSTSKAVTPLINATLPSVLGNASTSPQPVTTNSTKATSPVPTTTHAVSTTKGSAMTNASTAAVTTASTTTVTSKATAKPTTAATTSLSPVTSSMSATLQKKSGFDLGSFIGGIVLTLGLLAAAYFGCRFYNSRRGVRYRTIDEHEAII